MTSPPITLNSTVRLSSGHLMPLLGFGVYNNYDAKSSVLEAFKAGYRHVESAQVYRNEAAVAEAVRESGLNRGDVFICTHHVGCIPYHSVLRFSCQASKCVSRNHGYEQTLKGIDESLARMKFGMTSLACKLDSNRAQTTLTSSSSMTLSVVPNAASRHTRLSWSASRQVKSELLAYRISEHLSFALLHSRRPW